MIFRSRSNYSGWEREDRTFPQVEPTYAYDFDKTSGRKVLVKTGETNVYIPKQEAVQDTLVYNLIDQVQRTGNTELLGHSVDGFIDAIGLPKNLMEAENIRIKAETLFNSLPLDVRKQYGSDYGAFLKDMNHKLTEKQQTAASAAREAAKAQEVENNESK